MTDGPPRVRLTADQRASAVEHIRSEAIRSIPLRLRIWWTLKSQEFDGKPWQDDLAERAIAILITERNRELKSLWLAERGEIDRDLAKKLYKAADHRADAYSNPRWWL